MSSLSACSGVKSFHLNESRATVVEGMKSRASVELSISLSQRTHEKNVRETHSGIVFLKFLGKLQSGNDVLIESRP